MERNISVEKALEEHKTWVETKGSEGRRFDLSGAYLEDANFSNSNLSGADFTGCDLPYTDKSRAYADFARHGSYTRAHNLEGRATGRSSLEK